MLAARSLGLEAWGLPLPGGRIEDDDDDEDEDEDEDEGEGEDEGGVSGIRRGWWR